jgi:hypothetical protein
MHVQFTTSTDSVPLIRNHIGYVSRVEADKAKAPLTGRNRPFLVGNGMQYSVPAVDHWPAFFPAGRRGQLGGFFQ